MLLNVQLHSPLHIMYLDMRCLHVLYGAMTWTPLTETVNSPVMCRRLLLHGHVLGSPPPRLYVFPSGSIDILVILNIGYQYALTLYCKTEIFINTAIP